MEPQGVDPRTIRRALLAAGLTAIPWAWFLVRDTLAIMEGIAVALPLLVVGSLLILAMIGLITRSWVVVVPAVSVVLFGVVAVLSPRMPLRQPTPPEPVRIVSANVLEGNPSPAEAVDGLLAQDPDVIAVVEGNQGVAPILGLDYSLHVEQATIAVYSRNPIRLLPTGAALHGFRVLRARIWGPDGPFLLYAVHSLNPLYDGAFSEQLAFFRTLVDRAELGSQPVVVVGDFNMTDRGQGYRAMATVFDDALRSGWAASTYDSGPWRLLSLRIDYEFVPKSWCATDAGRFDIPGSDHEGVAASVGPCPVGG